MRIGFSELAVVFIIALFVLGPDKLPMYAKKLGEALAQFKKYSDDATRDIKESIVEPLEEAQRPLREAVEPLAEIDRTVRGNVKDVRDSFNSIGKKPAAPPAEAPKAGSEPEAAPEPAPEPTAEPSAAAEAEGQIPNKEENQ